MRSKFNYKVMAVTLGSLAVVGSSIIGICASTSQPNELALSTKSGTITVPTNTTKLNTKIGAVRHYQNNSFSGVKVKNGGFVALTGDASATRTDMFGNVIWEFDPKSFDSNDFKSKKVIEVVQDETNPSIFYLLLVPTEAPNELADTDAADPTYYDEMIGNVKWQASVVQIQENIWNYSASTWSPYFTVLNYVNIDPQQMVNNYPSSWKANTSNPSSKQTTTSPSFFDKKDHPSWYINGANEKVNPAESTVGSRNIDNQSSGIAGTKGIVLPWKQYITNLGNMYAKDGQVFIFGGNGSMYNDPEALSIGMFRVTFGSSSESTKVVGIPYAYLLSNLQYNLAHSIGTSATNWDKCYAPIKQDANFNYVPRLAVGGVQTNVTSDKYFLYLSGAITVGQVANSQNRAWEPNASTSSSLSNPTATSLQQQRSLQLSGANVLAKTNESDTTLPAERNSIDPCLLFGTAFNISELGSVNVETNPNASTFSNVLINNSYFDIGSTVGNTSTSGTYYFFDQNQLKASKALSSDTVEWNKTPVSENSNRLLFQSKLHANVFAPNAAPTIESTEVSFPRENSHYTAFDFFKDGKSRPVYEFKDLTNNLTNIKVDGTAMASYSWNLPLLVDNARNYYYPTLCYGYSLKSVSSLTKVSHGSQAGYAMQVGKSILFVNEPKFDTTSLVYHGPSSVSIGTETDFGSAKFGNTTINSDSNSTNDYVYRFANITNKTQQDQVPTAIEIMKQLPFSYSGDWEVDKSILATGTTQLVAGIKDLNLTVSDIAGTFKISADPYATATSQKKSLPSPTLSWNQFMGLTSTTDGGSVVSSWAYTTTSPEAAPAPKATSNSSVVPTKSRHFALTSQSTFSDFGNKDWNNLTFQDGVKQGWFEDTTKQASTVTDDKTAIDVVDANMTGVTKDKYFKSTTTANNPGVVFDHGLSNSGNPVIYGQQILSSTGSGNLNSGIAYVNVGASDYKTTVDVTNTEVLGKTSFKANVTLGTLGITSVDQLFDKTFNNGQAFITNDNQYISLVKNEYVSKLLNNYTAPDYSNSLNPSSKPANNSWYQIYAFIDSKKTKIHFVAYAWNPLTKAYDMSPAASGGGFVIGNEVNLPDILPDSPANNESQTADDSWIVPVAVTVPIAIILIALIVFFVVKSRKNKY